MQNFMLKISYDGTSFYGWQKQPGRETVQGKMESIAASLNGGIPTDVNGAGRTDRGVHALGQVANVMLPDNLSAEDIKNYFNRYLPESVRVESVLPVDSRFHARLSTKRKTYSYSVCLSDKAPVFTRKYVYTYGKHLDFGKIESAIHLFEGTHDFACFATKGPGKKSTLRTVSSASVKQGGELVVFDFTGDGFLYNQIRIMVGTLLEIGSGSKTADDIKKAFESGNREYAGFTAPPLGLCLMEVEYGE